MTYGEVALEAGYPGAARAVGSFLSRGDPRLPWWRVVTSTGRLVPGNEQTQAELLVSEGVLVMNHRVVMSSRHHAGPS
jgi:alkylated DNA nucleotide flippase Atl1